MHAMEAVNQQWQNYVTKIASAKSLADLYALEQALFGRKQGALTLALKELGTASPEERKTRGQELNEWKMRLSAAIESRRSELATASFSQLGKTDPIDVTLDLPPQEHGHLHPIPEFIRHVDDVFGRMGFQVVEGPEIESEENNFLLLNFQKDHAAMDMQATFWLTGSGTEDHPGKRMLLRTHTSGIQVRHMKMAKPPFRIIYHGKTYRKDADATHSPMFHQFEALMVGKDISLAHMKAVMSEAIRALVPGDIEFRFRSSYFPFVEPGLEVDLRWIDSSGKPGKWLEIAGCGMVHPNVLRNGGIDPKKWRGFAFGFGVERMIMIKHRIPDLRSFYEGDMRFLRQF